MKRLFCRLTLHNEQKFRTTVFANTTRINTIRYSTVLILAVSTAILLHDMHSSLSFPLFPQLTSRQHGRTNERTKKKRKNEYAHAVDSTTEEKRFADPSAKKQV